MTTRGSMKIETFKASGDLSTHQYKFVKLSAGNTVQICTVLGERSIGVLLNKPTAAGMPAEVAMVGGGGKLPVLFGATITFGQRIATSAAGLGVVALTTNFAMGEATETTGASGEVRQMAAQYTQLP